MFDTSSVFQNYSSEHWITLLVFLVLIVTLIMISARFFNTKLKNRTMLVLAFIPLIALIGRWIIDYSFRPLTLQEDLPLHLCRILSFVAPIVVLYGNTKSIKVFIYLSIPAMINAMVTADIDFGFPHYGFIVYWLYHGTLLILAFYLVFTYRIYLSLKDAIHSFLILNLYFIILHFVNISLQSNYMYSRHKPEVASLMDVLGEWPVYLVWLEVLAFAMLIIIHVVLGRVLSFHRQQEGEEAS